MAKKKPLREPRKEPELVKSTKITKISKLYSEITKISKKLLKIH